MERAAALATPGGRKILVYTWNVGNKAPLAEELEHWLPEHGGDFDLVVVGTQENGFKRDTTRRSGSDPSTHEGARSSVGTPAAAASLQKEPVESDDEEDREEAAQAAQLAQVLEESPSKRDPNLDVRDASRRTSWISSRRSGRQSTMGTLPVFPKGTQSVVEISTGGTSVGHRWDLMCAERLGDGWTAIVNVALGHMRLAVYCTKSLVESGEVHHVSTARAATGIAGTLYANKGGLAARLTLGLDSRTATTLGFVATHLQAFEGLRHYQKRNEMGRSVLLKTMTDDEGHRQKVDLAHDVDHLIWMGDLNYRIDLGLSGGGEKGGGAPPALLSPASSIGSPPPLASSVASSISPGSALRKASSLSSGPKHAEQVKAVQELIAASKWEALLEADELKAAQRSGEAFVGFREGVMDFAPTYKVQRAPGLEYKIKRTPSYTDRILWKSMPSCDGRLTQLSLRTIPQTSTSDHKPVVAAFVAAPSPHIETHRPDGTRHDGSSLKCTDLTADFGFGNPLVSDLFVRFYMNPEGLLSRKTDSRGGAWRHFVKTNKAAAVKRRISGKMQRGIARWADAQTPHLHVAAPIEQLGEACLLMAIFDKADRRLGSLKGRSLASKLCCGCATRPSRLLGVVTVPLKRPALPPPASAAAAPQAVRLHRSSSQAFQLSVMSDGDGGGAASPAGAATDAVLPFRASTAPAAPTTRRKPSLIRKVSSLLMMEETSSTESVSSRRKEGEEEDKGYTLRVDAPLVLGHSTAGTGRVSCSVHVRVHEKPKGIIAWLRRDRSERRHKKVRSLINQGDYLAAEEALRSPVEQHSSAGGTHSGRGGHRGSIVDIDVSDEQDVRSRVNDLTRRAELKWRYKVVDKSESAHDEAIHALELAKTLLDQHQAHMQRNAMKASKWAIATDDLSAGASEHGHESTTRRSQAEAEASIAAKFRRVWAAERSAVLFGLCATHLIFMTGDEAEIEAMLNEGIELREEGGLHKELAETLNSLGLFKQRQGALDEAERSFIRSLELRRGLEAEDSPEARQIKHEAIAQSLVSLGNLAMARGDAERDAAKGSDTASDPHYAVARGHYELAAASYTEADPDGKSPKIAHAFNGLGKALEKERKLGEALEANDRACEVWRRLLAKDASKELFTKDLDTVEERNRSIRRQLSSKEEEAPAAEEQV